MPRPRPRPLVVIALVTVVGGLAWLASAIAPSLRIGALRADGRTGLQVAADLPAATCRKTLTTTFPWVRFECEPRGDDRSTPVAEGESAVPSDLDSPSDTE